MVTLPRALDTILEEVGGKLCALLLVVVGTRPILVWVALWAWLKLEGGVLCWRRWHRLAVVAAIWLLTRRAGRSGTLGRRGATRAVGGAEVLLRELMCQSYIGIISPWGVGPGLVNVALLLLLTTVLGAVRLLAVWGLGGILSRILVLREVALGRITR